jgi:hypothetical protein
MQFSTLSIFLFSFLVTGQETGDNSKTNLDATVRKIINEELLKFVETMSETLKLGKPASERPAPIEDIQDKVLGLEEGDEGFINSDPTKTKKGKGAKTAAKTKTNKTKPQPTKGTKEGTANAGAINGTSRAATNNARRTGKNSGYLRYNGAS